MVVIGVGKWAEEGQVTEIVVALEHEGQWDAFRGAVHRRLPTFDLRVLGTTWRASGEVWPQVEPGDEVWVVWGTIARGHAPLMDWRVLRREEDRHPVALAGLDLRGFAPETLPWRFRDSFRRGWRYLQWRPGQAPIHFSGIGNDTWEAAGKTQREVQVRRTDGNRWLAVDWQRQE